MMTNYDKQLMAKDVEQAILDWAEMVHIWTPKPIEEQPNWNELMREINGEIMFNKQLNVPVDVRDVHEDQLATNASGDKYRGQLILSIPPSYVVDGERIPIDIEYNSIFYIGDNTKDKWRVYMVKRRHGERLVHVIRMVGDDECILIDSEN